MADVITSYNRWVPITKSDTVNFDGSTYSATASPKALPCDAIYVGTAGVVAVVQENGQVVNFTCIAGAILPLRAIRVNDANTVPTLMNALYFD